MLDTDGVPDFKWAKFPVEAPAHGPINFNYGVGNLRNSLGRITERARQRLPNKRADAIFSPNQGFETFARVVNVLSHVERGQLDLLRWLVLESRGIERPNLAFVTFALLSLIKAGLGLITEQAF